MKRFSLFLMAIGFLMILINVPVYVLGINKPEIQGVVNNLAFLIGINAGFILGAIFILLAFVVFKKWKRKINKKEMQVLIDSFGNDAGF